ncbi:MAG TPA: aldo/keto reductase [Thermoplasmata archaeon]|nr:aldo/keto reductase [Thermoplasmata archaeon]
MRELGRTGIAITPVGLGTWAIGGGGWEFAWGPQDDQRSTQTILRAAERGINWIDTAPAYGTGHAEEVVGKAVQTVPARPRVFTKVSLKWTADRRITHSLKADSIREEVDASRKRLRTDTIDLVQVHWPEPEGDIGEGWRTLAELKDRGLIRHIGVSNFNVEQMERAGAIAPVETLQPPYSLVAPDVEREILPYARSHGIGVIVYSPMGCGLLTGTMTAERVARMPADDWRRHDPDFREPRLSRHLALARLLGEIGKRHGGRSAAEVAVAWTLANPAVSAAIVGGRSPEQVDGFVGAMDLRLTREDLVEIEAFRTARP